MAHPPRRDFTLSKLLVVAASLRTKSAIDGMSQ